MNGAAVNLGSSHMSSSNFMLIGHLGKPHGLDGYIEVVSVTDNPERFAVGNSFRLNPPQGDLETVTVTGVKEKRGRPVLRFADLANRDAVADLRGVELLREDTEAAKPPDAFWVHDIVGCQVVTNDGQRLGEVAEVQRTGGNDVYIVSGQDKEYLIPAIHDVIKNIDIEARIITIEPLPGLLDL